ncbi:unnamed protein product [Notodromas monacha]|uniref:SGF29 C-terminal domain-containing protein n=1 Tax=Notodromas monacha TaxID=399045 RepID=A0A7R9GF39_9CRUS|nr:unnamed protein product [Notodromas monacha]CAG0920292.1 unnamed protein product [Notodromas monacha]
MFSPVKPELLVNLTQELKQISRDLKDGDEATSALERFYEKCANEDSVPENYRCVSTKNLSKMKTLLTSVSQTSDAEEQSLRRALGIIHEIRTLQANYRHRQKATGQHEVMRRGALMMLLQSSASTLPLYVTKGNNCAPAAGPPALCGCIPAEANHVSKSKMKTLLTSVSQTSDAEEQSLRRALGIIHEIRTLQANYRHRQKATGQHEVMRRGALMMLLQSSASTLPLYVTKGNNCPPAAGPPALCGCIPAEANHVSKPGDMVAAQVRASDGDENWILAEVMAYDQALGKYEVEDIDIEQKERHNLNKKRVVPLPNMRADPITCPEALFPLRSVVHAIYPQTTCFYKAQVGKQPAHPLDDYLVLFEDSQYPDGLSPPLPVAQRYIISLPGSKRAARPAAAKDAAK